jgi:hypothetical protein
MMALLSPAAYRCWIITTRSTIDSSKSRQPPGVRLERIRPCSS